MALIFGRPRHGLASLAAALAIACALPAGAQQEQGSTGSVVLMTYRDQSLTKAKLNSMVESQKQMMASAPKRPGGPQHQTENTDLHAAYGWVREEALLALADQLKVKTDEKEIQKQEQALRKQLTPENWAKMKASSDFAVQAVEAYRAAVVAGEKDNATLRNKLWKSLGGEQNPGKMPRTAFNTTLDLFGRSDDGVAQLKASMPQSVEEAVADARKQFAQSTRLQAVQDEITKDITLSEEDIQRAQYGMPPEMLQQMQQAPGGLRQALLQMKKMEALERWLRPRILKELKFTDKKFERRFKVWLEQQDNRSAAPPPPPPQPGSGPPPPQGANWR